MICPDINLLLYAVNEDTPQHCEAKRWWTSVLSSAEPVGLSHVVVLGFIRLSTNRKVFSIPLTMEQATDMVDSWLQQPNVEIISPSESHWQILKAMLKEGNIGSSLTTDAHIAALASEYGMIIYSNDVDFARFPNIKMINPLASK